MSVIDQQRVQDAIKELRSTSSFENVIWFEFEIKHLVRSLSQFNDDMTCLDLFDSLTEVFSSEVSTLVTYELSKILYFDEKLSTVSQWKRMLTVCSRILTTSNFSLIVKQFLDLTENRRAVLSKNFWVTMSSRVMSDIEDFAQALHAISLITRDVKQRSIIIVSDSSYEFLTAFAYWFLALKVEIWYIDSSEVLYAFKLDCESHIIILYDKTISQRQELAIQIFERTYMMWQVNDELFIHVDDKHVLYYEDRVSSDRAIRSAFENQERKLLASSNLIIMLDKAVKILWLMNACERSTLFIQNSMSLKYLNAALILFSELSDSINLARKVVMKDSLVSFVRIYERTLKSFKRDCSCKECSFERNTKSRDQDYYSKIIACLEVLTEILISVAWDLKNINVLDEIINFSLQEFQHYYFAWE